MPQTENALIDALYNVSNPGSARHVTVIFETLPVTMYSPCAPLRCRYGEHLSKEQVAQLIAPHQDTRELVHSWLGNHDIPSSSISMTRGGSWLTLTGVPVSRANVLLGASYQLYRHTETNDTAILRTIGYSLPVVLHARVKTIVPTTYFSTRPLWKPLQKGFVNATADMAPWEPVKKLSSRDDNELITPSVLRSLYRMAEYVPGALRQNVLGVTAFLAQYPNPTDFINFMTEFRSDAVDPVFTYVPVNNGGYDPDHPGFEANSNIQYAEALVYPTPIIFYSTGGDVATDPQTGEPAPGDLFMEWLKFVLDKVAVPQTITMSYSAFEKDIPLEYADFICNMFAELGARGSSVLIASGNFAVGGLGPKECLDASGRPQFLTEFPPTCMSTIKSVLTASGGGYKSFTALFAISQVPLSPPLVERPINIPRSGRASLGVASQVFFLAPITRKLLCPPSCNSSAASIKACTSAFSVAAYLTYSF
jgi:tripeptidyl-peptidase-1